MVSPESSGIAPALHASVLDPRPDHRLAGSREVAGHGNIGQILDGQTDRLEHNSRTIGDRLVAEEVEVLCTPRLEHRERIEDRLTCP